VKCLGQLFLRVLVMSISAEQQRFCLLCCLRASHAVGCWRLVCWQFEQVHGATRLATVQPADLAVSAYFTLTAVWAYRSICCWTLQPRWPAAEVFFFCVHVCWHGCCTLRDHHLSCLC